MARKILEIPVYATYSKRTVSPSGKEVDTPVDKPVEIGFIAFGQMPKERADAVSGDDGDPLTLAINVTNPPDAVAGSVRPFITGNDFSDLQDMFNG